MTKLLEKNTTLTFEEMDDLCDRDNISFAAIVEELEIKYLNDKDTTLSFYDYVSEHRSDYPKEED